VHDEESDGSPAQLPPYPESAGAASDYQGSSSSFKALAGLNSDSPGATDVGGSPSSGVVDGYYYDEGASSAGPDAGSNVNAYHDLDVTLGGGHGDGSHGLGQHNQYMGGGAGAHGGGGGHGLGQGNQYLGGSVHDHGGHSLGRDSQYGGHGDGGQYLDGGESSDGMLHPPDDDGAVPRRRP